MSEEKDDGQLEQMSKEMQEFGTVFQKDLQDTMSVLMSRHVGTANKIGFSLNSASFHYGLALVSVLHGLLHIDTQENKEEVLKGYLQDFTEGYNLKLELLMDPKQFARMVMLNKDPSSQTH